MLEVENISLLSTKNTKRRTCHRPAGLNFGTNYEQLKLAVLLHNGGFATAASQNGYRTNKLSLYM
jgi:hypothetical protein